MDQLELIRDPRPISSVHSGRRHSTSSDEDTYNPTIHSRRKSSLALEKAEGGFKGAASLEKKATFRMTLANKPRNRMWLRSIVLLLTIFGLIYFFLQEDQLNLNLESDAEVKEEITEKVHDTSNIPILGDVHVTKPSTQDIDNSKISPQLKSIHCTVSHPGRPLIQYALMIDAGSTGSRIHVYRFNYCKESPELEDEIFNYTLPGLSAYPNDPLAAAKSLDSLLDVALKNVPPELYHCTPVAVKATAGLRMLGPSKSERILEAVENHLKENYPFPIVPKDGVVIMDGKDEGVYAWITVNYLLERIGKSKKFSTAAIFDLGGGSTQIVFEPEMDDGTVLEFGEHRYELSFGGHVYVLYQHSYLHYGLMEARKSMKKFIADLWRSASNEDKSGISEMIGSDLDIKEDHVPHPCLPKNYTEKFSLDYEITLIGTGAGHAQCRFVTEQVLNKDKTCQLSPCAFDGIYQPPLKDTFSVQDIYAFSYFYDRVNPLGMPSEFSLKELRDLTDSICSGNIEQFSHLPEAMKEIRKNPHYCMDLTFIYGLLHIGYEIPLERELKIAKKINDIETGWCLGAAIAVMDQNAWCKST
ncbi:hypothetical protein Glove_18g173 [Diversispora epigaea]|uniref:guanosine-diphosphatase n=1 Tax=Diversispora epigaea TaxID=1348612 RepID=A0A397JML0_9GLOM|nr:hypothetical protein Glove_18g173 [Diversispora epigaea]